jgi:acyl-CoA oxidase
MQGALLSSLRDPQLRPFLPLVYVAWADGDLDDEECVALRERLAAHPWVAPAARAALAEWFDPAHPPGPEALQAVLVEVRRAARTMDPAAARSLAELGAAMAGDPQLAEQTRAAYLEIEAALGLTAGAVQGPPAPEAAGPRVPAFDAAALQRLLGEPHAAVRAEVREFLADPAHRASFGLTTAEQRAQCHEWLQELARRGFGDGAFPGVTTEAADVGGFLVRFESLAYGDLSLLVKFGVQYGLFGGSIFHLGSERHRALLADVAALKLVGCFAMSETGHGSNVADIETTARYDEATGEFEIHTPRESARKDWIGGAATYARMATVFAQLEVAGEGHGVHAFLVEIRDEQGGMRPGVHAADCGPKMGLGGVDNGRLWFDRVRVPRSAMLDRFARVTGAGKYESEIASPSRRFFTMLGTLVAGRVSIAGAAVSVAKVGLAVAIRYAAVRRQFGPPEAPETTILDYPAHQSRLLPALATTYALHFAVQALQARYTRGGDDGREVEALAAGLKAYASWHATSTLQDCRECCGGQGYLSINRIAVLKDDSDVFTTFEGDNTVLMQLVAKGLLTAFKQQFAGARFTGMLRHVARRAATVVLEKNPIVTRMTDAEHLRDREFHGAAFRYREERLLQTVAQRMRKRLSAGLDGHHAAMAVQEHLLALAHAHVERVVFEAFAAGVRGCPDAGLQGWLERLCDLYALSRLAADMGWFVEDGYVEPWKARAIRKEVERLCVEVRAGAVDLVNAFGIPDTCLAAPIAFGEALT